MILSIKTNQPQSRVALLDTQGEQVAIEEWEAGKQLSNTLLKKIEEILEQNKSNFDDLSGVVVYKGPGSYTGLRIGASVANTIAYSQSIPIASKTGDDWEEKAVKAILNGDSENIVSPEYGGEANITKPRK